MRRLNQEHAALSEDLPGKSIDVGTAVESIRTFAASWAKAIARRYDRADELVNASSGGTANDATFTLDALGRFRTRAISGSTDTPRPTGSRVKQGATLNWLAPDLKGNVAAAQAASAHGLALALPER